VSVAGAITFKAHRSSRRDQRRAGQREIEGGRALWPGLAIPKGR
jgi:hypothetical protein